MAYPSFGRHGLAVESPGNWDDREALLSHGAPRHAYSPSRSSTVPGSLVAGAATRRRPHHQRKARMRWLPGQDDDDGGRFVITQDACRTTPVVLWGGKIAVVCNRLLIRRARPPVVDGTERSPAMSDRTPLQALRRSGLLFLENLRQ
ncbi:hypothetical protein VTN77DRAFT_8276 [Rasamsonia byssochlamydoides]|uniref:uncharacterized protein n=1 Tax=Rasamsonia byssochlamydoides TaxID=89139 RepID=UPI003742AA94